MTMSWTRMTGTTRKRGMMMGARTARRARARRTTITTRMSQRMVRARARRAEVRHFR
jgi:hypothetical protein